MKREKDCTSAQATRGLTDVAMTENRFEELQRDLEQTLKAAKDPVRRRFYLREMAQLLAEGDRILQTPKKDTTGR
jgi:hypothetical protein